MIIDSHVHFWQFDPVRDNWITDEMSLLKNDFMPEDLLPELSSNHIDGCVAVQADQSYTETGFLLMLAEKDPFIKGVVGWVDLRAKNITEKLEYYSSFEKFKGVRHIVQAEPQDDFLLRDDFRKGIAKLQQFGLTYDLLIYPRHLSYAAELVSLYPDQRFVVDHIAKPDIKEKELLNWEKGIRRIAQYPNVYCKLSGMFTEADWKHWKADDFVPYMDVVLNAFGTDRVMFGSDWPVCLLAVSYQQSLDVLQQYIKQLSAEEKAKVIGLNTQNFYRL